MERRQGFANVKFHRQTKVNPDKLMNLVGELVLARNQLLQSGVPQKNAALLNTYQRVNLITKGVATGLVYDLETAAHLARTEQHKQPIVEGSKRSSVRIQWQL